MARGPRRPPAGQPLLLDDDHQTSVAWMAFFQDMSDKVAAIANLHSTVSYANDAAAAAAGVPVGGLYRNGSAVMVRVV